MHNNNKTNTNTNTINDNSPSVNARDASEVHKVRACDDSYTV